MTELISFDQLTVKLKTIQPKPTVVLVTGCFDILHTEHVNFLRAAKKKGNRLVVGLESDRRVEILKGRGRPVNKIRKRTLNLVKINIADFVFILPEKFDSLSDYERLIAILRPDILAVSSHTSHQDKKKEIMQKYGGELRVVWPHNPNISSSKILAGK